MKFTSQIIVLMVVCILCAIALYNYPFEKLSDEAFAKNAQLWRKNIKLGGRKKRRVKKH